MRRVETHAEISRILEAGRGYLLNDRAGDRKLHHASCDLLQIMAPPPKGYPKYFSENPDEARVWLDTTFGEEGWVNCGTCLGFNHRLNWSK